MQNVIRVDIDNWKRPWDIEKYDNLYDRDERFFSILMKGVLAYLNKNIVLNGNSITHYIFNTGSSYMYLEKDGYEFSMCETSGEDQMYMKMPRCVCELGDISIPQEELTSPYIRGMYERISEKTNKIESYSAEIRRLPIEMSLSLHYVLSTTNEGLVLMQELIDKLVFQKYFNIAYLGQKIKCSIEFPQNLKLQFNKIDFSSAETRQRNIDIEVKICTNYPIINLKTECDGTKTIANFKYSMDLNDIDNQEKTYQT